MNNKIREAIWRGTKKKNGYSDYHLLCETFSDLD